MPLLSRQEVVMPLLPRRDVAAAATAEGSYCCAPPEGLLLADSRRWSRRGALGSPLPPSHRDRRCPPPAVDSASHRRRHPFPDNTLNHPNSTRKAIYTCTTIHALWIEERLYLKKKVELGCGSTKDGLNVEGRR
ncbi:uncharacterized protein LOC121784510 [Salvia splendens]|uniref:uncharacterized protein LOC121784510 n=1 Tax=Salvia splendens TaxID=180675 RepID=UPI001C25BB1B|nr:uncharacterized protein LOC121784510 [Salvia splendens]